jgi:hypothetical protein
MKLIKSWSGSVGATIKKSNFACVYMGNINQFDSGEWYGLRASFKFGFQKGREGGSTFKMRHRYFYPFWLTWAESSSELFWSSVVRRPSVSFYIFWLLQNHWANFNPTWHISPLGERFQFCSNEGNCPSPRGDNSKRVDMNWNIFKIFSTTSWPNSIKLGTNYPWVKGIQVCSIKGPGLLQRGDNHKNVKMGWGPLKIFSRTTGPILTTLHKSSLGVYQVCSNEGDNSSLRGDYRKRIKMHWKFLKNLLQNQQAKFNKIW